MASHFFGRPTSPGDEGCFGYVYVFAPATVVGAHPEVTAQLLAGMFSDPMSLKSLRLNRPYRDACRLYITAIK
ncbi:MAG: hypothetical protein WAM39_32945 [Bryobacteraceae bacterium]